MPTKPIHLILLLTILLAGCAPAAAAETPTPLPSRTPAPPSPTPSKTSFWRIITSTITPTPTPSPNITMTPLPFNACPTTDEEYRYPFPEEVDETEKLAGDILEALNNGLSLTNLQKNLSQIEIIGNMFPPQTSEGKPMPYLIAFAQDLTGDGVEEIVFINRKIEHFLLPWTLHVFSCQQGKYAMTFHQNIDEFESYDLRDLNNNGIPEIIIHHYHLPMQGPWLLYIFEWDGEYFRNLIPPGQASTNSDYPGAFVKNACYGIDTYNLRNDRAYDVILRGKPCGFGDVYGTGPYRAYTVTLSWDGTFFQPGHEELDPPTYLFQAVQDGDRETMRGNYEKALTFYNQTLSDPNLKGWSEELYHQQWDTFHALNEKIPAPTPAPTDPNEREILTAYVHYRLMLIYSVQGDEEQAKAEYGLLSDLSPEDPGYPYKGLAAVYWEEYQNTKNPIASCTSTRKYAERNADDIYDPINDNWHGFQSPGGWGEPSGNWSNSPSMEEVICPFGEIPEKVQDKVYKPARTPTPTLTPWKNNLPPE